MRRVIPLTVLLWIFVLAFEARADATQSSLDFATFIAYGARYRTTSVSEEEMKADFLGRLSKKVPAETLEPWLKHLVSGYVLGETMDPKAAYDYALGRCEEAGAPKESL